MNDSTKPEDKPADDGDWLGYGVYADTLWARIERALKKDLIDGELGDDPMVIGIFGEWGAGKSQLLKLIERRAKASLKEQKKKRESDAGFELTVPVWFQPWKYEHEEHLHVPMVIHVLNALKDALKHEATVVDTVVNTSVAVVDSGKKALPVVQKTLEIANSVYPVIQKILKSITVFGCNVDLPDEVSEWLETAADGVSDIDLKNETKVKISTVDASVKHTTDGSYFYRIHELLGALTRPHSYKHRKDLFKNAKLTLNTRINFVIFIDDLDRCLPEKAVQTLELIKTMFNVESFAFVLALDDEVIERGIGHRYQAYNFAGKKPEMPITGFEYLEKIVHLPFKLPALTQSQAKKFITHVEKKIAPNGLSWFARKEISPSVEIFSEPSTDQVNLNPTIFDLGDLTISAFDAYVPRKLTRLVELWYNTVKVAQKRHEGDFQKEPIALKISAQIDVRIVFVVMLVQLFHPDLYRVFRRHEQTFKTFFDSFVPGGLSESISDIDLWRWAAFSLDDKVKTKKNLSRIAKLATASMTGEQVASSEPESEPAIDLKTTLQAIAKLDDGYRFPAQQKRLPLVERLIEHRAAQRHVFDPLKLFEALKMQMPELPVGFKIAQYFSFLSEFDEDLTPPPVIPVKVDLTKRFTTDANLLYNSVISADKGMQEAIPTLQGFDSGYSVSALVLDNVYIRVTSWIKEAEYDPEDKIRREIQLLQGLTYLARYIAPAECEKWWRLVRSDKYKNAIDSKLRAQWHDVRAILGQDYRFEGKFALVKRQTGDLSEEPVGFAKIENDGGNFYISRYLVTVAQYAAFRESDEFKNLCSTRAKEIRAELPQWEKQLANANHPVVYVNWFEANAYANWLQIRLTAGDLNAINIPKSFVFRLPTDAEWEQAARGGLSGKKFPWGDQIDNFGQFANVNRIVNQTSTVGSFAANKFGLFDCAGNVWEWLANPYEKDSELKTLRGGSWDLSLNFASCSYRHWSLPDGRNHNIGFRLVLSLTNSEA